MQSIMENGIKMSSSVRADLKTLMTPESIAIVGASPKGNRGSKILANLARFRYPGRVYVVNPKYKEVQGFPCFPTAGDLPEVADLVAVALPAEPALEQLDLFGRMGTRAGLMIGGGLGEGGDVSQRLTVEEICQEHGMRLCGPNCYGILNVRGGMAAYSGDIVEPLVPGNVAFVLQSGALSHATHNTSIGRGVGISHIITSGNEISVEMGDYLEWLVEDPDTSVIALFIEGLKKSETFIRASQKALALGKPIVALKVGRSVKGKSSAIAHTGSVAGDDTIYDGLFKRLGIIQVDDIDEFREMVVLLSRGGALSSSPFALCSLSGGITTLLADLSEEVGLDLPEPSVETVSRLSAVLPGFATISNPLDMTGQLFEKPDLLEPIVEAFAADENIGGIAVALNTPFANRHHLAQCKALVEAQKRSRKPLVCFSVSSAGVDEALATALGEAGIPFLLGAREAVLSLKRWGQYVDFRRRLTLVDSAPATSRPAGPARPRLERGQVLTEGRAISLLSGYGVPFAPQILARSADEAVKAALRVGYPVALKIDVEGVAHKSELNGIILGIRDEGDLRRAYGELVGRTVESVGGKTVNGVTVQKMVPSGLEVLVGVRADAIFGPQIVVGPGGVLVEMFKDVAVRGAPVSPGEVREMIKQTALGRLIGGFRGSPPFDEAALVEAILSVSAAANDLRDDVQEIDINPLIVLPHGRGVFAVDAVVAFKRGQGISP